MKSNVFTGIIWLLLLVFVANATIMPPKKGKKKANIEKKWTINAGPVNQNVFDRGLLSEKPTVKEIIAEGNTYYRNTSARLFDGPTLGFVTPWNNHGYEVAKTFGDKFDIISPVWLRIVNQGKGKFEILGTKDIDEGWVADVRKATRNGGLGKYAF